MLLSDRMRAVVGLVQPCKSIADIGCDHGYVTMELIRRKLCSHVIAMDINSGPLDSARRNIADYDMQDYIETRLSDGVSALDAGEVEGIICAGMGGKLVISILEQGKKLVNTMKQVILQPQSELDEVRSYLRRNGFFIEKEDIIYEDGKYYPMMRALPGSSVKQETQRFTRIQDTYGPYLLETAHPILKRYLLRQKTNLEDIRKHLLEQQQMTDRQQCRVAELEEKLGDIAFCLYYYYK